jgi:hypothetical protein
MRKLTWLAASAFIVLGSGIVFTDDGGGRNFRLRLRGLDEVPVISTTGRGSFRAAIKRNSMGEPRIEWTLKYSDLEGAVLQSHIHFGPPNNTGGISIFLCTNLANGPAGTEVCPLLTPTEPEAEVSGVATAAQVVGPLAQGIEPGAIEEIIAAIRDGKAYVNVHSQKWPAGEIRQQFPGNDDHDGHR